jgi:uncharacterized protein (UPF0128 family)
MASLVPLRTKHTKKLENVIDIHKKGTKSKCENYREITLLPTAYKLFASIIKNRLNKHLENEMEEEQCGFRKGRSCTDAIFTMQQIIEKKKRTQPTVIFAIHRLRKGIR